MRELRIKLEHLDKTVSCPATGKDTYLRTLDPRMYGYYYGKGYEWLFVEVEEPKFLENFIEFFDGIASKKKDKK